MFKRLFWYASDFDSPIFGKPSPFPSLRDKDWNYILWK
jgi:hypothetical protein